MNNGKIWKLLWAFVALLSLVVIVWYSIGFMSLGENEEKEAAEKYIKDYYESYEDDPYGGETPEETIALFIDALEKGDIELASKYFVLEEQEKIESDLTDSKQKEELTDILVRMKGLTLSNKTEETAFFVLDNKEVVNIQVTLGKGLNGKWKIIDM